MLTKRARRVCCGAKESDDVAYLLLDCGLLPHQPLFGFGVAEVPLVSAADSTITSPGGFAGVKWRIVRNSVITRWCQARLRE